MPFIGRAPSGNSKIKKLVFTASGSQVDFAVASNASDEMQVFLNGVLLKLTDDYTYTTSTVTLGSGATVSDIVEVHVYQSFSLADAVAETGHTMTGELEVPTVKLSSNVIKASDGGSTLTLDTSDNLTVAGNIQVGGNIIKASDGGSTITLDTSDNVTIGGDLKVGGNDIQDSGGTTCFTFDGSGNTNLSDKILQRPTIKDYGESVNAIGSTGGGTQDIDLSAGNVVTATVDTSANTFTFSNPSDSGKCCSFTLILTNGGSQTVNWPGAVDWAGGTEPTLTASGIDIFTFITIDGGTIWYGFSGAIDTKTPS